MKNTMVLLLTAAVLISVPLAPSWVRCPESIEKWFIEERFTYQEEPWWQDYWKKPHETVKDKGGDCEDFAFLVDKILSDVGYETKVIAMYYRKRRVGHAIAVIKIGNKYTWFCNMYYGRLKYDTIRDLLNDNYPDWGHYYEITIPKRFKNRVNR
jgi:hypothetical protein